MENLLTTLISGNIGTVILAVILWRSGLLKFLLDGKNGKRDFNNGQPMTTIQEVAATVAKLENHFNDTTTGLLQDIKSELHDHSQKLDRIIEMNIFIKAKINGQ